MQYLDLIVAHFENLVVFCDQSFISGLRGRPEYDLGSRFFLQVEMATDKVGMKMGFKNIFYLGLIFLGPIDIGLYLTKGVKYGSFSFAFQIIGRVGQTSGVYLFYFHCIIIFDL